MDLKKLFKAVTVKAKEHKTVSRKLAKSYVSLFLVLMLGVSSTFAWFTEKDSAKINSGDMEFQSASSLRINKDKSASNIIRIEKAVLDEASSTDGRNIYFPLDKSFTGTTSEMRFREANAGDRITGDEEDPNNPLYSVYSSNPEMKGHYVYKDFVLRGTSGNTPVYIKSYEVKIENAADSSVNAVYHDQLTVGYDNQGRPSTQTIPCDNCPIRLAFIADSGNKPVVIDPSAQEVDYVDNSADAVSLIDENGVPTTVNTYDNNNNWNAFSTYYYGNTPLFVIPGGETLDVTLVIWLEGALPNSDKYIGAKVSVDIDIESNFAEMETIKFVDGSQPDNSGGQQHWVSNDNPIIACSYEDPYSDENPKRWKTVIMSKSPNFSTDYTWTCKIPKKAVSKISFYRLSRANGSTQGTIYNAWHTTPDIATWITASSISSSWYRSGSQDLQTTRQFTDNNGNRYNSLVYTAVHGNGYSVTDSTPQRLAPCVGYWDYSGGSGGAVTPTSPSGGGSGGSSASTYSVTVIVDAKGWVEGNVNGGSKLHFQTSSGGDYQYTSHSGTHFEQTFTLNSGDEITGFYLLHMGGSKTNLSVNSIFTVTRSVNVVYTQQNNDSLTPNLLS